MTASDEWHQHFIDPRGGRWTDVAIDTVGATAAILALRKEGKTRPWAWLSAVVAMLTVAFFLK
ncbi:hypothetical protein BH11ARM2_BH11ARM2_14560 [soil metagenome]